jgi:hypothetical protein
MKEEIEQLKNDNRKLRKHIARMKYERAYYKQIVKLVRVLVKYKHALLLTDYMDIRGIIDVYEEKSRLK